MAAWVHLMRTISFGQLVCTERLHDERQICQAYLISNKPIFLALLEHALHDVVHTYDLILVSLNHGRQLFWMSVSEIHDLGKHAAELKGEL